MTVTLRPAVAADEERLLAWRNDPTTRASAFDGDLIPREVHRRWFGRKLADPGCAILIAEDDGRPVGQVRLDRVDANVAEVHIAVAPEERGRGVGRQMLVLSMREARPLLGVARLRALVKRSNEASLAVFRAAEFGRVSDDGNVVELEREVAP